MDIKKLQSLVVDALEDVKGQEIALFDTTNLTSLFDRIAVVSGTSNRQTKALAASVRDKVKAAGGDVQAPGGHPGAAGSQAGARAQAGGKEGRHRNRRQEAGRQDPDRRPREGCRLEDRRRLRRRRESRQGSRTEARDQDRSRKRGSAGQEGHPPHQEG
jgi:hypothetical protein